MRLVPNSPSFDKVGILLAAECWLLLDAPGCRGKLRSSRETHVSGRKINQSVLAINVDAELNSSNQGS